VSERVDVVSNGILVCVGISRMLAECKVADEKRNGKQMSIIQHVDRQYDISCDEDDEG
jgi:hypothetical protein